MKSTLTSTISTMSTMSKNLDTITNDFINLFTIFYDNEDSVNTATNIAFGV